jgi:hypothetical protein
MDIHSIHDDKDDTEYCVMYRTFGSAHLNFLGHCVMGSLFHGGLLNGGYLRFARSAAVDPLRPGSSIQSGVLSLP